MIYRVAAWLEDTPYEDTNTNNLASGGTSATVASDATTRWEAGDIADWLDDGTFDAAQVTAVAATALTLRRGYYGTTAAAHDGSVTAKVMRKNPLFLSQQYSNFVDEAIRGLWPHAYLVRDTTYTIAATPNPWYAVDADTEEVLEAYQRGGTPEDILTRTTIGEATSPRFVDTSFASTGLAIRLTGVTSSDGTLHVINTAKQARATLTNTQADLVVASAARIALERLALRTNTREAPAIYDVPQKLSQLRRLEREMREDEAGRLSKFLPQRNRITYRGRLNYPR